LGARRTQEIEAKKRNGMGEDVIWLRRAPRLARAKAEQRPCRRPHLVGPAGSGRGLALARLLAGVAYVNSVVVQEEQAAAQRVQRGMVRKKQIEEFIKIVCPRDRKP